MIPRAPTPRRSAAAPHGRTAVRLVIVAGEERAAVGPSCARSGPPHRRSVDRRGHDPAPQGEPAPLPRTLRERVRFHELGDEDEAAVFGRADVAVFASDGDWATPGTVVRALGAGAVVVASRLPVYQEVLADGELGLMFEPGEIDMLAAHLTRLVADRRRSARAATARSLRAQLGWGASRMSWNRSTRSWPAGTTTPGQRPAASADALAPLIDVDLHMHTDHSYDCATPVEVLLAEARQRGLGRSRSPTTTRSPEPWRPRPRPRASR